MKHQDPFTVAGTQCNASELSQSKHYYEDDVERYVTGDAAVLSESQHLELSRIARSRSLPAGYVFRAKLILAEGVSYNYIKLHLGTSAPTISRWEAALSDGRAGWAGYCSSWAEALGADGQAAGADSSRHAQAAQGWLDTLELPQAGRKE